MKRTVLAYIAGIFDAEGSICIGKERKSIGMRYRLETEASNTNEWLIRWLQFVFGGSIYKVNRCELARKDIWLWHLSRHRALEFLYMIMPYLKLKSPQAELAIQFQEARQHIDRKLKTDAELAIEEAQRIVMSNLNRETGGRVRTLRDGNMKKVDWAYLAGLIDGDGSIYILRHRDKRKLHQFGNYSYAITVQIGIRDEWFVRWLKVMFGGSIWKPSKLKPPHINQTWYWRVSQRQALDFLKPLMPYLRLKKAQAELSIKFQLNKRIPIEYSRLPKTTKEFENEKQQAEYMATLNKVGI